MKHKRISHEWVFQRVCFLGTQKVLCGVEKSSIYENPVYATVMQSEGLLVLPPMQGTISSNSLECMFLGCREHCVQNIGRILSACQLFHCQKAMPSGCHPNILPPSPRVNLCHDE